MRVSGLPDSPFYWLNQFRTCPAVVLDGALVPHVIDADEERGKIKVIVYKDDKPLVRGDHFVTRIMRGHVSIIGIPRHLN